MSRYKNHEGVIAGCVCGKRLFFSRSAAKKYAKKVRSLFKHKMRVYRCPQCNRWHLTTKKEAQ